MTGTDIAGAGSFVFLAYTLIYFNNSINTKKILNSVILVGVAFSLCIPLAFILKLLLGLTDFQTGEMTAILLGYVALAISWPMIQRGYYLK